MATKRMFTPKITESDSFLDMPATSQNLYFHLCMNADDDGFVGNPKRIERMIGSSPDDNRILYSKGFTIPFESGIIVIKHWRMHNVLRKDRYNETAYLDEKKQLYLKDNGSYTLDKEDGKPLMATKWQPNGNQWLPQSREDKSSEEESNIVSKQVSKERENINNNLTSAHTCESYDEVFDNFCVDGEYRNAVINFIRHLKVNFGLVMLNERLEKLIIRLDMVYRNDNDKVLAINDAIAKGYKRLDCEG